MARTFKDWKKYDNKSKGKYTRDKSWKNNEGAQTKASKMSPSRHAKKAETTNKRKEVK